ALCELGYVFGLIGRTQDSLRAFRSAIDCDPECAKAHKALGNLLLQEDQIEEAIASCQRAVKLEPSLDVTHFDLAVALSKADRLPEAIQSMRRAVQLASDNAHYYFSLAGLLREARRYEEALGILTIGLDIEPRHTGILEGLCEIYLEQGMLEQAITYGNRLLRV